MSSFFLFLNSRNTDYGSSANFTVNFERSGIDFNDSEVAVGLDYAIFPNLLYPIRANRNKVVFNEGAGNLTATIAEGYYNSSNFPTALKTALDAAGLDTYTVTISSTTGKITIASTGNFSLDFSDTSSEMWKILGFPYSTIILPAASHTGTMPLRLDGDEYVCLMLENISTDNASSSFSMRGILDIIPLNGAFGDVIYYRGNENNNLALGTAEQFKQVRVRITDIDGYDIPLPDNAEIFLKLRIISTINPYPGQT